MILVDAAGENEIVVAPGANTDTRELALPEHDAVLCQLEIPDETVASAWEACSGVFCLNAAPARPVEVDPDLTVVNRFELEELIASRRARRRDAREEGATLLEDGEEIARAAPPQIEAVDGTAAGDAFTACLLVSLLEGREYEESLRASLCGRRHRSLTPRRAAVTPDRRRDRRDPRLVTLCHEVLAASSSVATSRFGATMR